MSKSKIMIENLTQSYGNKEVLSNLSLEINRGLTGLIGRNGAGKTTLMKTLVTLLTPKSGNITICNIPLKQSKEIRKIIGYLPQEFSMYPSMKVWEVLDYLGVLSNMPKSLRRNRIEKLLVDVNLEKQRNKKVKALSGGMKRRLGVAQGLLHDPKVFIADEPTVGLDPEERVRLRHLLQDVSKEKIVLLSTHIVEDIEAIADEVAILEKGNIQYSGNTQVLMETTGADSVETAYLRIIQSKEVS